MHKPPVAAYGTETVARTLNTRWTAPFGPGAPDQPLARRSYDTTSPSGPQAMTRVGRTHCDGVILPLRLGQRVRKPQVFTALDQPVVVGAAGKNYFSNINFRTSINSRPSLDVPVRKGSAVRR